MIMIQVIWERLLGKEIDSMKFLKKEDNWENYQHLYEIVALLEWHTSRTGEI